MPISKKEVISIAIILLISLSGLALTLFTLNVWDVTQKGILFNVDVPKLPAEYKPIANHTVVVLIDGLRYDTALRIAKEGKGILSTIYNEGAWFEKVETVFPSISPVVRASALTATLPEIHGYTGYGVENYNLSLNLDFNVFKLAGERGYTTAIIADPLAGGEFWKWVDEVIENKWLLDEEVHNLFINLIEKGDLPNLIYVCYVDTDTAGHKYGGISSEYYNTALNASIFIEEDFEKFYNATNGDAIFIVFSDHGHTDKGGHGGTEREVMHSFLGFIGKNVIKAHIYEEIKIYQIGATVSFILGIPLPKYSILPPIFDAFNTSAERVAGYKIHFAHLKINQIRGLAEEIGRLSDVEGRISELNSTLSEAYKAYGDGNYTLAESLADGIIQEAVIIFNKLLSSAIFNKILIKVGIVALLIGLTSILLAVIGKRYNILYSIAGGSALYLISLILFIILFLAVGESFSMSGRPIFSSLIIGIISGLIAYLFILYLSKSGRISEIKPHVAIPIATLAGFLVQLSLFIISGIISIEPLEIQYAFTGIVLEIVSVGIIIGYGISLILANKFFH